MVCLSCSLEDGIQALEKEANIDFCRSMNRIIFDQIIEQDPSTFAFVSVPDEASKPVPAKGKLYNVDCKKHVMFISV